MIVNIRLDDGSDPDNSADKGSGMDVRCGAYQLIFGKTIQCGAMRQASFYIN